MTDSPVVIVRHSNTGRLYYASRVREGVCWSTDGRKARRFVTLAEAAAELARCQATYPSELFALADEAFA